MPERTGSGARPGQGVTHQNLRRDPTDVRVAMRASGNRSDGTSDGLVDWVGEPRSFTPWIAQG